MLAVFLFPFGLIASAETITGKGFLDNFARSMSHRLRDLDSEGGALRKEIDQLPHPANGPTSDSAGFHARVSHEENQAKWVQVDLGREVDIDAIALVPAHV